MFAQRWIAYFKNGHVVEQPADDRYSKYDPSLPHNPSAFQDVLDTLKKSCLLHFDLVGQDEEGNEVVNRVLFDNDGDAYISLADTTILMHNYKFRSAELIFYRQHEKDLKTGVDTIVAYVIGVRGNDVCNHIYEMTAAINDHGECIGDKRIRVGVWTKDGILPQCRTL